GLDARVDGVADGADGDHDPADDLDERHAGLPCGTRGLFSNLRTVSQRTRRPLIVATSIAMLPTTARSPTLRTRPSLAIISPPMVLTPSPSAPARAAVGERLASLPKALAQSWVGSCASTRQTPGSSCWTRGWPAGSCGPGMSPIICSTTSSMVTSPA